MVDYRVKSVGFLVKYVSVIPIYLQHGILLGLVGNNLYRRLLIKLIFSLGCCPNKVELLRMEQWAEQDAEER
jgi:hypothetical protein